MSKVKNPKNIPSYWDEFNKTGFPWYKKGKMKRIGRKRWITKRLKDIDRTNFN